MDILRDERHNTKKRSSQWLESFECCLKFEGVEDPSKGNSKKCAALLAIGRQQLRKLFKTLTPGAASYNANETV